MSLLVVGITFPYFRQGPQGTSRLDAQTVKEADTNGDGHPSPEAWKRERPENLWDAILMFAVARAASFLTSICFINYKFLLK